MATHSYPDLDDADFEAEEEIEAENASRAIYLENVGRCGMVKWQGTEDEEVCGEPCNPAEQICHYCRGGLC